MLVELRHFKPGFHYDLWPLYLKYRILTLWFLFKWPLTLHPESMTLWTPSRVSKTAKPLEKLLKTVNCRNGKNKPEKMLQNSQKNEKPREKRPQDRKTAIVDIIFHETERHLTFNGSQWARGWLDGVIGFLFGCTLWFKNIYGMIWVESEVGKTWMREAN